MISQEKITVHLPKMLPASGSPSVRFRFFHSASIYIANMVSHCSNIQGKIAKCNSIISWWRKRYFLSYMSRELFGLLIFFLFTQLYVITFQMKLYLQSFQSLFLFHIYSFWFFVICSNPVLLSTMILYGDKKFWKWVVKFDLQVFFIDSKVIGLGRKY